MTILDTTLIETEVPVAPGERDGAGAGMGAETLLRFTDYPLREPVLRAIQDLGYIHPTEIQAAALPPLLEGADVVGQAQTGSGKTAAFGIPIVNDLTHGDAVGAIVLVPTRELCRQVTAELEKLAKHTDLRVLALYGGTRMRGQFTALERGVDIVVGTPGRV
ncbi:MAG: DEAD/DEAH box helicase, partial [Chloroflexota bacterium]|nr:DEAD/DEAH box helicase [Chloroflexota bacterium]